MKPSNPRSRQAFCFSFFNYFDYGKGFQKCNHMNEGFIIGPTENVAPSIVKSRNFASLAGFCSSMFGEVKIKRRIL